MAAVWLLGILFAYNAAPDYAQVAQGVALVWIVPLGIAAGGERFLFAPVFRQHPFVLAAVLVFLAITLPQALFSASSGESVSFWALTVAGTVICAGIWSLLEGRELAFLRVYSLLGIAVLTGVLLMTYEGFGRFDTIRNPNAIGLIVISLISSSFAFRSTWVRGVLIGAGVLTILAASSRSALVGAMIVLTVSAALGWKKLTVGKKLAVVLLAVAVLTIAISEYLGILSLAADRLFLLNDPYRGIGTGFTRRQLVWQETYDLFLAHPWFGVGYRTHQSHLIYGTSSHNGYLALLAEVGVLGTLPVAVIVTAGLRRLFRAARAGSVHAGIGLSLAGAYLFIALFERFMINFGNPTSVLFLMFMLLPEPRRLGRRVRSSPIFPPNHGS
jgi:O-antigen ligase